jgi:protein-S-isoprenylcysteine O-methyltransferase Ste14
MEKRAGWLFRYRGQVPLFLILLVLPFILALDWRVFTDAKGQFVAHVLSWMLLSMGLIFRAYVTGYRLPHTSGRNRTNQVAESLNQLGAYSLCQHPLYFANILLWIGGLLLSNHLVLIAFSLPLSLLFHLRLMRSEQLFLTERFGEEYRTWSAKTSLLLPSFRAFKPNQSTFNFKRVLATEYPTWVTIMVLSWGMLCLSAYHEKAFLSWGKGDTLFLFLVLLVGFGGRFYKYVWLKKKV